MKKFRYSVVIEWDLEEKVYVAIVPAFPISTYGETRDEALEKVKEAITVTIEGFQAIGRPVPEGDEDKIEVIEVAV